MVVALCIDDDPSRAEDFTGSWGRRGPVRVVMHLPEYFAENGPELLTSVGPDLALVDLRLNLVRDGDRSPFRWEGPVIAAAIREQRPVLPIYGYSSDPDLVEACRNASSSRGTFDDIWLLDDLFTAGASRIARDVGDFATIARRVPNFDESPTIRPYVGLLRPPASARAGLEKIIRADFLVRASPGTRTACDYWRWLRRVLLPTPGPLRSWDYTAKLLGLSDRGMNRISRFLRSAAYSGPFAHSTPRCLWSAEVERMIVARARGQGGTEAGGLSRLAFAAFDLRRPERVNCCVCREPFPEVVAVTPLGDDVQPVHVRCSRHHEAILDRSLFDERREYSLPP
jgi:hypothetical protein